MTEDIRRLPAIECPLCRHRGEPGAGFIPGPDGPTEQVGFFCLRCGEQIPTAEEWADPAFREAVMSSMNPFEDAFPSRQERLALASDPGPAAPSTVDSARAFLHARLDEGVQCPVCQQHAQRYYRTLNSGMARWLIVLTRLSALDEWVTTAQVIQQAAKLSTFGSSLGSGEAPSILPFFGLIEAQPNTDPKKRTSGAWRPTEKGRAFVAGWTSAPRTAVVYNNKLERLDGPEIVIKEALGKRFSYEELMNANAKTTEDLREVTSS